MRLVGKVWVGVGLAAALLGGWCVVANSKAPRVRKVDQEALDSDPALQAAYSRFLTQGGAYIWESNDCSVFVSDYLRARQGASVPRLTTMDMVDHRQVASLGLQPVDPAQAERGDILVYRYRNAKLQARGHCGIVVEVEGAVWVAHNSEAYRGVVLEQLPSFLDTARRLGATGSSVVALQPNTK